MRDKITDPAYAGWFLKNKPGGSFPNGSYHVSQCDHNYDPPLCSNLYHDNEQTPCVIFPLLSLSFHYSSSPLFFSLLSLFIYALPLFFLVAFLMAMAPALAPVTAAKVFLAGEL